MSGTPSNLHRYLGGSPAGVLVRLVFLSLIVGAIMAGLGLTPGHLVQLFADAFHAVFYLGFDAMRDVGRYILTGAVIVVPIWFLVRLSDRRPR